jgi:hypothetical protein
VIALNANKLQILVADKGFTYNSISKILGITKVATYRKLNNINAMTIGEAIILKNVLELSDVEAVDIFFGRSDNICKQLGIKTL